MHYHTFIMSRAEVSTVDVDDCSSAYATCHETYTEAVAYLSDDGLALPNGEESGLDWGMVAIIVPVQKATTYNLN